jgi:prolyl-tRNA synthetase
MKDCYSFHLDTVDASNYYHRMAKAYANILDRLQCPWVQVEADSGNIGGDLSHEFHIQASVGEDELLTCNKCSYAANVEKACSLIENVNEVDVKTFKAKESGESFFVVVPKGRDVNLLKLKHLSSFGELESLYSKESESIDWNLMPHSILVDQSISKEILKETFKAYTTSFKTSAVKEEKGDFVMASEGDKCSKNECQVL